MEYVDEKTIEGFQIGTTQQLAEAIEFAVGMLEQMNENNPEEQRQAAQDALMELMTPLVDATEDAYYRSPIGTPDFEAIALIFKRLAIRAKLKALCARTHEFPTISVETRKSVVKGTLFDVLQHDGMESAHIGDEFVPLISIIELHA